MERQRSVAAYRAIDLMLWAAILLLFEGLIIRAARSALFADQAFTVSLAGAITCIVYMRWGAWGMLHAALAGLAYSVLGGGRSQQILIYTAGNLLSAAVLPLMNRLEREEIRASAGKSVGIGIMTLLLMQIGRALLALLTGVPIAEALRFFTTDSLSLVFTGVIVWIVRRLDGVFEDQQHYLRRIHQEQEKERMEQP